MSSGNLFKVADNDKRIVSIVKASNVKSNHLEVFSKENVLKYSKNPKITLAKESFFVKILALRLTSRKFWILNFLTNFIAFWGLLATTHAVTIKKETSSMQTDCFWLLVLCTYFIICVTIFFIFFFLLSCFKNWISRSFPGVFSKGFQVWWLPWDTLSSKICSLLIEGWSMTEKST